VESGYVLHRQPDTVRGPDISFVSNARMGSDHIPREFIPGTPDLAVEVLSPSDRPSEIAERIADYFGAGARLVWVVDPDRLCVVVHHPDGGTAELGMGEVLDGEDVVPGFRCDLAEVFGIRRAVGERLE
jgi:Uma2 family endonuclease